MGSVTALGAAQQLDTFETPANPTRKQPLAPKKIGFQPRPAVMNSAKPQLTNVTVSRPMAGKVLVTAREGYLSGTMEGCGDLIIDIYEVKEEFRGRHLGQALIELAVKEVNAHALLAELDYTNGQALRKAGGDADQTPFGKAARALGFTFSEKDGHYFVWTR